MPDPDASPAGDTAATGERQVVILSPADQNAVITTRELMVEGYVRSGAGPVKIVIESSGSKVVAVRTVQPRGASSVTDAGDRSHFSATFPLSNPRPGGRMVVQVIAYDLSGMPLDSLRRRITIGAFVDPGPAGLPGRPALGEDGLIGGIPFDTDRPPASPGQ